MINYPGIDPVALRLGALHIHWYGLMYLFGFIGAWGLARYRVKRFALDWSNDAVENLIFYAAIGVVLGGRLGYMLFYSNGLWYKYPLSIFQIWEGGMSFHGGLVGVILALLLFARKTQRTFLSVADFIAPLTPLGLGLGRLGNFINSELWGRVTSQPWGMIFPFSDGLPRHPSQLYEFALEGVLLFMIVWGYARRPRPLGYVSAVFLIGYALCRITVEFFREPDFQLGYLAFGWLTMGQLLSVPILLLGLFLLWRKQ